VKLAKIQKHYCAWAESEPEYVEKANEMWPQCHGNWMHWERYIFKHMIAHSSNPFQGSMTSNYQTLGNHLSREYQHTHMCVCVWDACHYANYWSPCTQTGSFCSLSRPLNSLKSIQSLALKQNTQSSRYRLVQQIWDFFVQG